MNQSNPEEIAWAAGLFEGEGCICNAGKFSINLSLNSTDRDVVEQFRSIVGAGGIYETRRSEAERARWKPIFNWHAGNAKDVRVILNAFLPWLNSRRRARAEAALERLSKNQGLNGEKTHCLRGHPLSGDNLYRRAGRRYCRACRKFTKRGR